jgi:hypothetical protein
MHGKERAIAPLFDLQLGMKVILPNGGFDSDRFGTFTRDIPRQGSQLEAARAKELSGLEVAIASEGSFTPHPAFPFVAENRELVILVDQVHQLEVVGEAVSIQTNFAHQTVFSVAEALDFAQKVGFPEHGLVIKLEADAEGSSSIVKGVIDPNQLEMEVKTLLQRSASGTVWLETDMRAMYNPSRMAVIMAATQNLIQKLQKKCPACGFPGFDRVECIYGLPCGLCHQPTDLIRAVIWGCQQCQYRQEQLYPNGQQIADPGQCSYCNP